MMRLVRSIRFRSTCSSVPLIGSFCQSTIMTGVVSPPWMSTLKMVLCPVLLCRIWCTSLGLDRDRDRIRARPVDDGGDSPRDAQTARFVLAARRAARR